MNISKPYQQYVVKAITGIVVGLAFIFMGYYLNDHSTLVTRYLAETYSIHTPLIRFGFVTSGIVNIGIGIFNLRYNFLWFSVWSFYSTAAAMAYIKGVPLPLFEILAYQILTYLLLRDAWLDFELRGWLRYKRKEA